MAERDWTVAIDDAALEATRRDFDARIEGHRRRLGADAGEVFEVGDAGGHVYIRDGGHVYVLRRDPRTARWEERFGPGYIEFVEYDATGEVLGIQRFTTGYHQPLIAMEEQAADQQRAEQLLDSCLSLKQRQQMKENNWFIVHGGDRRWEWAEPRGMVSKPEHEWRLGLHGTFLDGAARCIGPKTDDSLPRHDFLLALKLLIETDEPAALKLAADSVW